MGMPNTFCYIYVRLFHQTTICLGDNYTGKNFLPPIKTRSPVVKAVKLMAWLGGRQNHLYRLPPDLVGKGQLHKFPNN